MLPIKTTIEDLDKLLSYLRTQIGAVDLTRVRGALDSKTTDNRKLEAAAYVGLIEREGQKVEITAAGRRYASTTDPAAKAAVMSDLLRQKPLYVNTVEWMHYNGVEPVKTAIGDYWYKNQDAHLEGAKGAALTDAVVFFMRFADAAGLGKFISAGKGRPETYFKGDPDAIARLVLQVPGGDPVTDAAPTLTPPMKALTAGPPSAASTPVPPVSVPLTSVRAGATINVNIEIHIPSGTSPESIAEILRSVRDNIIDSEPR